MFWIVTQSLLSGLATTFEIFILTLIFALPLGLILAFGLLSKFTPLKRLVHYPWNPADASAYHYLLRAGPVAA
jgi:ABC-type amino acid transport system permease subunit